MIFVFLLVNTVVAVWRRQRILAVMAEQRARFFRNSIVNLAVLVAVGSIAVDVHPDLTAADVGWRLPEGNWSDYLYTGYVLVLLIAVYLRSRKGPLSPGTTALLPRTSGERLLAGGAAVAFGVGEEFLYRGLLLAAGTELLGLPLWVAAVLGWVLFVAAHIYQGGRALFTIGLLGLIFTMLYLSSMSLVLPIIVHTLWDLVFLLLIRPRPAVAEQAVTEEAPVEEEIPVMAEVPTPVTEPRRLRAAAPE
ncbi:CPBP family intramembrane glutamic endopeptidase [Actinoplanes philippinensis]|uniref:CPBP family intramembrane glutamic endopeptidase n=1 Tax=Actinoplanes philippinensis TaxID=35752 RepID=UPI0033D3C254